MWSGLGRTDENATVNDGASDRHTVIVSLPGLLMPVGFSCILHLDTLVTGLQYKALGPAPRRAHSSSYLIILVHGGTRSQEVGSAEAAYQN